MVTLVRHELRLPSSQSYTDSEKKPARDLELFETWDCYKLEILIQIIAYAVERKFIFGYAMISYT